MDDGDGCSALCQVEAGYECTNMVSVPSTCVFQCGDGETDIAFFSEGCDDSNLVDGDGCSQTCAVESGWDCGIPTEGLLSICSTVCGDEVLRQIDEVCDDGNTDIGDGCDATCNPEIGWLCTNVEGGKSICLPECGDG